jgi:hypothetical protein
MQERRDQIKQRHATLNHHFINDEGRDYSSDVENLRKLLIQAVADLGFKDWVTQGILSDLVSHTENIGEHGLAVHFDVIRRIVRDHERKMVGLDPLKNDILENAEPDVIAYYNEHKDKVMAFVEKGWLPS